ncbi:transmembrane protease serine 9 [Fopius arisanus]|uniref:Transmembrane protease serine 9 n=3 Tax=Fopius arisanus TaxID=64838 RepID=A0A9R1TK72_9HYME|nr:PREDICTED: transmembrane protease serine 9-like [Fopius arisanus]
MTHSSLSVLLFAVCLFYCSTIQGVDAARLRRVSGGVDAHPSDVFYQASLRNDDYHCCGGTILSEKHILTAAHCVADLFAPPYDDLTVVTGTGTLQGGNHHEVFNVSWHEGFQMKGHVNDIAVVTLKNKIDYNENQRPVSLPESPAPYNEKGVVSGFGRLKATHSYSWKILQKAPAVVISRDECQQYVKHTIAEGQICGLAPKGVGIQKGDSGGPFVVNDVVVGVASWNIPWDSAAPDGYTDVYAYRDFILEIMQRSNYCASSSQRYIRQPDNSRMTSLTLIFVALAINSVAYGKPPQRIVGGNLAAQGEIPYIVSISRGGHHFCGGSIISNRHILTAAHCVTDIRPAQVSSLRVRAGSLSSRSGGKLYIPEKIDIDPRYKAGETTSPHDIAIITIKGPMTLDRNTKVIELVNTAPRADAAVVASGWGLRSASHRQVPTNLYTVTMKVVSSSVCKRSHSRTLPNEQVCAFGSVGQGVCMGDSGGPLALNGKLAGVVSYGRPCAVGYPDVYTSVHHYRNWIRKIIADTKN